MQCVPRCSIQSQRELGGCSIGHYVITERWSQRGIKMFQTNNRGGALLHGMCTFGVLLENKRE